LAENQISLKELKKTIDLCELLVYYNERINEQKD
jgi:hypothetical protein